MRGYFSFLFVFAAVFSLFYISLGFIEAGNNNQAGVIALESNYQTEMNLKEITLETARQGAKQGLAVYALELATPGAKPSIDEAKERVKDAVYLKLLSLNNFVIASVIASKDIGISFWCADYYTINPNLLLENKKSMISQKKALPCAGCAQITELQCKDKISVDIKFNKNEPEKSPVSVGLAGFGFSLYSEKYAIASVGFIPQGAEVRIP